MRPSPLALLHPKRQQGSRINVVIAWGRCEEILFHELCCVKARRSEAGVHLSPRVERALAAGIPVP